jgi:hypothetical protein
MCVIAQVTREDCEVELAGWGLGNTWFDIH